MPTPEEFLTALHRYVGAPYLWGGKTATGLDCSGLITLALADVGVTFPHGSTNQIAAVDQIPVAEARTTPGAFVWRPGHDGISQGNGSLVEAIRPAVAVTTWTDTHQGQLRWEKAGLVPGIDYPKEEPTVAWFNPVPVGGRLTSRFMTRERPDHSGQDIAPPISGQQGVAVVAPAAGFVIRAGFGGVLANHSGGGVYLDHGSGVATYHGHLARIDVQVGDYVRAGQQIGLMGFTGNIIPANRYGTHLHVSVLVNGRFVDPLPFFKARGVTLGAPDTNASQITTVPEEDELNAQEKADLAEIKAQVGGIKAQVGVLHQRVGKIDEGFELAKQTRSLAGQTVDALTALRSVVAAIPTPDATVDPELAKQVADLHQRIAKIDQGWEVLKQTRDRVESVYQNTKGA